MHIYPVASVARAPSGLASRPSPCSLAGERPRDRTLCDLRSSAITCTCAVAGSEGGREGGAGRPSLPPATMAAPSFGHFTSP